MKISENWLKEWVATDASTEQLMSELTMLGLEVDGVEPAGGEFSGVVVAEIVSCEKHPDADKLKVCQVNAGNETLQIVCGAPNARVGLKTALSKIGAVLPGDFKIKKSKLRGVESKGMLCSEVELGISQESDGIIELADDAPVGVDVSEYLALNDQIIDIDLTPNRADCFCMRGVARDLATLGNLKVNFPTISEQKVTIDDQINVSMEAPKQCPKYGTRVIKGIDNSQSSPTWMKEKLRRSGIRSIHPVVDVTNYVMLELGQPMHAFDLAKIDGDIVVRMAQDKESLVLLDGSTAELNPEFLLIADQTKALAVAGVIGGQDSGVGSETQDIVLESAYFDPATIMGKSRKLGVHTESGMRFERGVDWGLQADALQRATELILQICGGSVAPINMTELTGELPKQHQIALTEDKLQRVLGFVVEADRVTQIFNSLGLTATYQNNSWQVVSPSWRFDMEIAEDLIEEVVRVVGYDQMPSHRLHSTDAIRVIPEAIKRTHVIKSQLSDLAYQEVINYSFVAEKQLADLKLADHAIALANPLNKDMAVMRTHLLPGLLANIKSNLARQEQDLALFEMGKVFTADNEIVQTDELLLAKTGLQSPEQWSANSAKVDFYDIKGDVEVLLSSASETIDFTAADYPFLHPGRQAEVKLAGKTVGYLGQVHPSICQQLKIKQDVYVANLNVNAIQNITLPQWQSISKFPKVRRDLSIVLKDEVTWDQVSQAINDCLGESQQLLNSLRLFDVYKGDNIEKGYKSLAMAMIFQEKNRTLEDKDVDKLVSKAVSFLAEQFNAEVRT
ncbi:phenylalanine--tRNA ligase subunit beta [Marinicella litoralis]|uniref:Phenylalanine--tRNA ligase beta subunit n=1 Tax=Marinicella litoralis TaxID=644220 RepID=A0A4R6XC07_9GAMM|nr:phenylalanine--tRNA ligase subunit beta [Marinicella litoralis]TDR16805.1 phenylalanyl-tRNA synthetase beta subunit [Marinicella litoralis]